MPLVDLSSLPVDLSNLPVDLPKLISICLYYKIELLLYAIFLLIFFLILTFLNQRSRYMRMRNWIKRNSKKIKSQESTMEEIGKGIKKFKKSKEGLDYWRRIKGELEGLSQLPSLEEKNEEIILSIHLSKLKKDDTEVTAEPREIKVNIYSGKLPLRCSYSLPVKIKPHKLKVTYKGNTLKIRAPKV